MQKIIFFTIVSFAILFASPVEAAKKFIPKGKSVQKSPRVYSSRLPAVVRYRGDKQGVLMSFRNFDGIESVSYSFTYNTNGMPQGAGGTITSANSPTSQRELLFGTCSGGVCRYHHNLDSARLALTAKLTNGKTVIKNYRIKTYQ